MKNNDLLVSVQDQFKNQNFWSSRLSTRSQWKTMTILSQYKVSSKIKIYDPLVSVQGQNEKQWPSSLSTRSLQKSKVMTLSSQYKVEIQKSDNFVLVQGQFKKIKIYYLFVSVKGQNEEQRPYHLSTRSVQKSKFVTLSSLYNVKMKNNNPLVSK